MLHQHPHSPLSPSLSLLEVSLLWVDAVETWQQRAQCVGDQWPHCCPRWPRCCPPRPRCCPQWSCCCPRWLRCCPRWPRCLAPQSRSFCASSHWLPLGDLQGGTGTWLNQCESTLCFLFKVCLLLSANESNAAYYMLRSVGTSNSAFSSIAQWQKLYEIFSV